MGDDTRLLSAVLVGHVPSLGPTAFRSPFPPCTRCLSSTQPLSLTPCQGVTPLLLSLFFYLFLLFNILITGLSRPKAPSPLSEKQNLTWLFSQLVPTPSHLLCCLSVTPPRQDFAVSLSQKGPRCLSAALHRRARCNPRMFFPCLPPLPIPFKF